MRGPIFIHLGSQTVKTINFKDINVAESEYVNMSPLNYRSSIVPDFALVFLDLSVIPSISRSLLYKNPPDKIKNAVSLTKFKTLVIVFYTHCATDKILCRRYNL